MPGECLRAAQPVMVLPHIGRSLGPATLPVPPVALHPGRPRATFPAHIVDVKRALAWIREHADEYGIDPDFIAVTGGSAGGHVALSTPSSSGLPARLMGRKFVMVCPPAHLELFSRRGLQILLDDAGFSPVRWTSFSGLGREHLRRGFQRFLLGDSPPARVAAAALAVAAELPMKLVDRAGYGIGFEVYAVAR